LNGKKLFAKAVQNWPVKVLSLALAIVLFVFHRMSTLETRHFFAPLIIENLNAMMPSGAYPRIIKVSLHGEAGSINSILENDIEAYVDMDKYAAPGVYRVSVQWRKKNTALGVEPLQILVDPSDITFSLDRKLSKFVPLSASFSGQVEAGFNMTSFSLSPSQIIIDGPAGLMGGVSELHTELIDLDGRRSDFSLTAKIMQRDPLVVIRGSGTTEFFGVINQIIPVRNISNVPIIVTGIKDGFTAELEVKTGNIHLEGDNLDAVNTFVTSFDFLKIDCSGISGPGTYVLRVLSGTAGNIIFNIEPKEVKIQVHLAEENQP
jgi:YbbR domain-containing protein